MSHDITYRVPLLSLCKFITFKKIRRHHQGYVSSCFVIIFLFSTIEVAALEKQELSFKTQSTDGMRETRFGGGR